MKVNIYFQQAQKNDFITIKLGAFFETKVETLCNLYIDYRQLFFFTEKTNGIAHDFFLVSAIVYGIDNFVSRGHNSFNGWTRELEVEFLVESPSIWNDTKDTFEQSLNFLTGDIWNISFCERPKIDFFVPQKHRFKKPIDKSIYSLVSLFSGGLDSLVGVIDYLSLNTTKNIVLVSHYDANVSGVSNDQEKLNEKLKSKYSKNYDWVQSCVYIKNPSDTSDYEGEITFRSRSFLFLGIGILIANSISDTTAVLIPENGTIAINHPLTPSRRSSCSTRTAHPYYLRKVQEVLGIIGINNSISNPYEFKTKGEMLEDCNDKVLLFQSIVDSCSCAKRKHRETWDVKKGTNHCGVCMPCLYRRAALNKINMDTELFGTDIYNTQKDISAIPDLPAFLDYLKTSFRIEDIERNILVNGSFPLDNLRNYALVIERTRTEIKNWINQKGNSPVKDFLGI